MKELIPVLMALALMPSAASGLPSPIGIEIYAAAGDLPLFAMAPLPALPQGGDGDSGDEKNSSDSFILNGDEDVAEVLLLSSDAEGTVVDFLVRGLRVEETEEEGETFQILTISERHTTSEVGRPQLPVIKATIAVPEGALVRAAVLDESRSTYSGYKVYPFQPPEVDWEVSEDGRAFAIDEEFYSQDTFYPENIVEVGVPGTWRDLEVVDLQVNPVTFNPATGELRVYDRIRVRLDYDGGTLARRTAEPKFARMYSDVILNYRSLDITVKEPEVSEKELPIIGEVGIDEPGPTSDLVKYLSIRHDGQTSSASIKPLLDWREEKGLPYISYYFNSSSTPSATDVKDVIAGVYASHPELEYVLLVGDIEHLPWNPNWGPSSSFKSYFPTMTLPGDYWYGCVAGSDLYPELAVGRISANDDAEVSQQVNKILAYEKNPPPPGDWVKRVLLVAHAQDAPGKYQGCKEAIRTTFYAKPFVFETVYGALPSEGGDAATNADVKAAIDLGAGIVNYRGHGYYTYWGADWNSAGEEYRTTDAHALNNGDLTPVVFSIACANAALDQSGECLAEAFVKDDDSAVAFLGASRPSWTEPNHDFDRYIFDAIGNEEIHDLGWILNDANVEVIAKYGAYSYATDNVKMYLWLGDPAMEVGVEPPNSPPETPDSPSGPSEGRTGVQYDYSTSTTDPDAAVFISAASEISSPPQEYADYASLDLSVEKCIPGDGTGASSGDVLPGAPDETLLPDPYDFGDQVKYIFDWGDDATSETGFVDSGVNVSASHSWSSEGIYFVKVRAVDNHGAASNWSDPVEVTMTSEIDTPGLFRPSASEWYFNYDNAGWSEYSFDWGVSTDIPVAGDWDGDGNDEAGLFRPSTSTWYFNYDNAGSSEYSFDWGLSTDIPVVGDWDGDGKDEAGLFRPSTGTWFFNYDNAGSSEYSFVWGLGSDVPVAGDWDGDGTDEAGLFRPSTSTWFFNYDNVGSSEYSFVWGAGSDVPVAGDWDDDGKDEAGLFRPSTSTWFFNYDNAGWSEYSFVWGTGSDKPIAGDWDGDGKDEAGLLYMPPTSTWFFNYDNADSSEYSFVWGLGTDIPVAGDWDGDGNDEAGLFRPSTSTWFFNYDNAGSSEYSFVWGLGTDVPVAGDWDGDGKDEAGLFRPSTGTWFFNYDNAESSEYSFVWGLGTDVPVAGDWDGDGKDEAGLFRPSTGTWFFNYDNADSSEYSFVWGLGTDVPVAGDWDGDGKDEAGLFRPSTGMWFLNYDNAGSSEYSFVWGICIDEPIAGDWLKVP